MKSKLIKIVIDVIQIYASAIWLKEKLCIPTFWKHRKIQFTIWFLWRLFTILPIVFTYRLSVINSIAPGILQNLRPSTLGVGRTTYLASLHRGLSVRVCTTKPLGPVNWKKMHWALRLHSSLHSSFVWEFFKLSQIAPLASETSA